MRNSRELHLSRRVGFTTIELLVVAGIIGLLFSVLLRFYSFSSTTSVTDKLILQMEARRSTDEVSAELRVCSSVIRPVPGETLPFLFARDLRNRIVFLYIDKDELHTMKYKKNLYRLILYRYDFSDTYDPKNERILAESIKSLTFTSHDPNSIQVNMAVANDKQDFQIVTRVGMMNLGDPE